MQPLTIDAVDVSILHVPPRRPIATALGSYDGIRLVVVRLSTSEGVDGQGWTTIIGTGNAAPAVKAFIEEMYAPFVVGRDVSEFRALWEELYRRGMSIGRKGVAMYALAALDIALWDCFTRALDVPIHRFLGKVLPSIPVYGAGYWMGDSIDDIQREAAEHMALGLCGVKLKIGGAHRIAEDLARIDAVKEVIHADSQLLVDANQSYDPLTAERLAHQLAERGVQWFEEPLLADSISDYAKLVAKSPIPIASGENEYSRYGFRDLIEFRAVDILQPDVHRVGGITEFMRIANLAEAFNMPLSPHTALELQTQLGVACGKTTMLEMFDWYGLGFWSEELDLRDGRAYPSSTPGIGVRIGEDALMRYRVS